MIFFDTIKALVEPNSAMSKMEQANPQITSDMRHNHNCYAYLVQLKPFINSAVKKVLPKLSAIALLRDKYQKAIPYGDLYSSALTYIEDNIDIIYPKLSKKQKKSIDALIFAIYHNNNCILEQGAWIKEISGTIKPNRLHKGQIIAKQLEDLTPAINRNTPKKAESLIGRISTLFTPNFKPQLDTNIPSIKNHTYVTDSKATEYRFGTQAQRHKGKVRISPLFKQWLAVNAKKVSQERAIAHIYFNNLGLDRANYDLPGSNEKELSLALHQLEEESSLKIAVITLPASHSIMNESHYKQTNDCLAYELVFDELLGIALGKQHLSGVTDFKISPKIRTLLFKDEAQQQAILIELLEKSFKTMGLKAKQSLSTAQKQAVWLHFIKFELTDYIIGMLNPLSYNFSCKDAIDRGTLSSLYYNLLKSFSLNQPMSQDEFERDLDIAAANVKGRGMNFHRTILWNAIDTLVNANYDELIKNKEKSWLIYWRDMNCPHTRVKELMSLRLKQFEDQLDSLAPAQQSLQIQGRTLFQSIKEHYEKQVNGQRLLLEVVSRSSQLLSSTPTEESLIAYKNLAKELQIKHPIFTIIAGVMQVILGALLLSQQIINQGLSRIKTGFFAAERKALSESLIQFSETKEISPV